MSKTSPEHEPETRVLLILLESRDREILDAISKIPPRRRAQHLRSILQRSLTGQVMSRAETRTPEQQPSAGQNGTEATKRDGAANEESSSGEGLDLSLLNGVDIQFKF